MADRLSRANITVYDPSLPGTRVLRVTTGNGHMTRPTDAPANTYYLPVLKQPADMSRHMFAPGTTSGRSKVGLGDVIISNADGALDGWMTYAFDGQPITIQDGTVEGGFTSVLVATMDGTPDFGAETITIHLRDRQAELDVPLQTNLYLGNNALPAGLEGVADLKGKKKPFGLGQFFNVLTKCVNTAKQIYQVTDNALASIDAVYDRGVALQISGVWGLQTLPSADTVQAATYGNGLWVLAGFNGSLWTSANGTAWTARASGFGASDIHGLAYGAGLYVAVGNAGKLATSPDGITWTIRTSTFGASAIQAIAYSSVAGLFVIAGDLGKLATSPDGITWTARASGFSASARGVAYGGGMWVVVAQLDIVSSPDGITWTTRSFVNATTSFQCVVYGNGLFLAAGLGAASTNTAAISRDGMSWQAVPSPFAATGSVVQGLACGRVFLAVGQSGKMATSIDGLTWSEMSGTVFGSVIYAATSDGNLFVAGGGSVGFTAPVVYANTTELLDDTLAPPAGCVIACPSAGYFRLGSAPVGTPTADAREGAAPADRTVAQLFKRALLKAGKTAADYVAADLVTLDALNSAVCGIWIDDDTTVSSVLDQLAGSIWAWWSPDRAGLYRIKQFAAPSGASTFTLTANDLRKPLEVTATSDQGKGVPAYRTIVRYAKNYTVQTTDLAAGVSSARRVVLAAEWQAAKFETAGVQTAHLLAPEVVEDSCLVNEADALAEATRRQGIRGTRRDRFPLLVELTDANAQIDFGDVGTLTHKRFGLAAGTLVRVLGAEPNKARNEVLLTVWR